MHYSDDYPTRLKESRLPSALYCIRQAALVLFCLFAIVGNQQRYFLRDGAAAQANSGFVTTTSSVLVPKFQEKGDPIWNTKEPFILSPVYVVDTVKR